MGITNDLYISCGDLPDKIHTEQRLLTISVFSAPNCFIANTHLVLIGSHLCPPQPGWSAQYNRMSVGSLLNLYVCTLCTRARKEDQQNC